MQKKYVLIDKDGFIIGRSTLSGPVNKPDMIEVDNFFDTDGKKWNGSKFIDFVKPEPQIDKQLTLKEFRATFTDSDLMIIDKLESLLEIDAEFDEICQNVSTINRDKRRDEIRTEFKNISASASVSESYTVLFTAKLKGYGVI